MQPHKQKNIYRLPDIPIFERKALKYYYQLSPEQQLCFLSDYHDEHKEYERKKNSPFISIWNQLIQPGRIIINKTSAYKKNRFKTKAKLWFAYIIQVLSEIPAYPSKYKAASKWWNNQLENIYNHAKNKLVKSHMYLTLHHRMIWVKYDEKGIPFDTQLQSQEFMNAYFIHEYEKELAQKKEKWEMQKKKKEKRQQKKSKTRRKARQ
jgi:hypothetical protein